MKKKYLALFLSTTLLASSFPATALAAHQVRSNKDVMWVFDGDTITAKGFPAEYNGDTVYMSYSEYDENWSGIPYTGHKFTAKVKNGQASFRLDGTEKDGLYKMQASFESNGGFLSGFLKNAGYFHIQNGETTPALARFEAKNLEDFTKLRGDSEAMAFALTPYYADDPASQKIIDAKAAEITKGLTDPYDKAKAIFDWVTYNVASAYEGKYDSDPVWILNNKTSICSGYTNLTNALLRSVGIPALFTVGAAGHNANNMYNHGWTTAFIDQRPIFIDSTWGSWNTFENGKFNWKDHNSPSWFDTSLHKFSETHNIWEFSGTTSYHYAAEMLPKPQKVSASNAKLQVDGKAVSVGAYTINGNTYFKLRDLAAVLNGTDAQFSVAYDKTLSSITLTSGEPYAAVGTEGKAAAAPPASAAESTAPLFIDGERRFPTAYLIHGNNYFKLRDLGNIFDFSVGWDAASGTITVDTSR